MDSASIRQSYLKFFEGKGHKIVPSASLLPQAPNLLFNNAGMNPFVPYFLEERQAPHPRLVDTQKCIRAGGKHNDLEDVGLDTYHHTFFEMLGNWSFGDYFKKEAIEWGWELLTEVWKLPKERLYVTVYKPANGEPADFDQEAYDIWANVLEKSGLDPQIHIVTGSAKDNFWMMGDTGPCGPCSEVHVDLTEKGDTQGSLVNKDSAFCMEIWNLVFIQFNAQPDGSFEPLANKHVDTGLGLERVAGMFASTDGFTKFGKVPSNYDSDLFTDIFSEISKYAPIQYTATVPDSIDTATEQEQVDVRMRALADHLRAVTFAIGDGILPGNEGRNYVIRHILRRGVLAAQRLGLKCGDFAKLIEPLILKMAPFFPELDKRRVLIQKVIAGEEEAFYKTIDKGLQIFNELAEKSAGEVAGADAFLLYDTYGFPLEMTEMIARERGMTVDTEGFEASMEEQRQRARAAQKKTVISVKSGDQEPTIFDGYKPENLEDYEASLLEVIPTEEGKSLLVFDRTPFYGEKGGQVGDTGGVLLEGNPYIITNTTIDANGRYLHHVDAAIDPSLAGNQVLMGVEPIRRMEIQRHHTATHLLHWALREVLGDHVHQAGSYVDDMRLRFDFSHFEKVSPEQIAEIEKRVRIKVLENTRVVDFETPFDEKPDDVLAFFEDKYGDVVRVVDIGGYSKELCAGTHVKTTCEVGFVKIIQESSIAAGSRRIEAITGNAFQEWFTQNMLAAEAAAKSLSCQIPELPEQVSRLLEEKKNLDKKLKDLSMSASSRGADALLENAQEINGMKWVIGKLDVANPNDLRGLGVRLLKELGEGVVLLGAELGEKVSVVALCSPDAVTNGFKAGEIVNKTVSELGGKGGGKPDFAMGGAKNNGKLQEVLDAQLKR